MSDKVPELSRQASRSVSTDVDDLETQDVHHLHAPIMREQAEPRDGFEPVPAWLTIFYGIIFFWGGYYLASYNGGFRADVYDEHRPFQVGRTEPLELDPLAQGERLYTINCSACHQRSGQGVAGQFPPLADSQWVLGDYGRLTRILLHGLQGPVEVAGATYNGNMPAFGKKLDDSQLSMVLSYIRQAWTNAANPIPDTVITEIRGQVTDRQVAWTAEELLGVVSPPLAERIRSPDAPPDDAADLDSPPDSTVPISPETAVPDTAAPGE